MDEGDVIQKGVYDAFREAGCDLEVFDYFAIYQNNKMRIHTVRQQFYNKALEYKPDLIHMQIQHTRVIDNRIVSKIKRALPKTIITNWTGDVRNAVPNTFKNIANVADYNFISSTGQLEMFKREIKKDVKYLQIGYDPKLYYPGTVLKSNFEWDCIFIANNNTKEGYPGRTARTQTCSGLRSVFGDRFALFGNGWPKGFKSKGSIDQKRAASAYHKSVCAVSVSHYNDLDHYFSDRLLMCMASGRPTISLKFPKWESYFTNNCDLVMADSVDDIANKVRYLKQNPELASYIGKSGAEKVLAEHTYTSRINDLLSIIGLK
ncbi:hypothetical protein LCGC14_0413730 [marine sediment metagenome]|uniref:Spore protein YkvP/CgeB glycosyl transferase-like domain-containing protein n=1 Tax=marine sediment metagenome TaxID=412755 RepID=A0A0F9VF06_9ZZZZ